MDRNLGVPFMRNEASQAAPIKGWRETMMRTLCAVFSVFVVALATSSAAAAEQPNIVYIMADELGYYELSCMGNPHIQTPRIDRMAREGIRFT